MVVAFYFRLHLAYFPRPVVAIFARPEQMRRFCVQIKFRGLICRLGIQPAHPLHRPQVFEFRQGKKL